jgi:hypothetical protein
MGFRPVAGNVNISGMALDADNIAQYMRAELHGADLVTHRGVDLNSDKLVRIRSGQAFALSSNGGLSIVDAAGSSGTFENTYVQLQGADGIDTSFAKVNPAELELNSLRIDLNGDGRLNGALIAVVGQVPSLYDDPAAPSDSVGAVGDYAFRTTSGQLAVYKKIQP